MTRAILLGRKEVRPSLHWISAGFLECVRSVGAVNDVPVLLPAGPIGPSSLFAGIWIQYQSMRRKPRIEVEHIDQRTSQHVERAVTYSAQIPILVCPVLRRSRSR